jgi:hypothetical protein
VAKEMEAILDVALQEWSNQVRAALGGGLPGAAGGPFGAGAPGGTGPAGNGNGPYDGGGHNGGGARGRGPGSFGNGSGNGSGNGGPSAPSLRTPPSAQGFGLPEDEDLL